jgi:crotonobetainyl-CoA:carnitine CoA-transferase CaiB-like acyl-CoA transferase
MSLATSESKGVKPPLALEGVKVVEYAGSISGQYCTKLLADLGAEVIKIEPLEGDETRDNGPFPRDLPHRERSGLFLWLNHNKMGITLNVKLPTGRKMLLDLLKDTDVFVENFTSQMAEDLDLDYPALEKVNGRLVLISITPFGRTGPYKNYKAYDIGACAAAGISVGIGYPDRMPLTLPLSQAGFQGGTAGASAALIALLSRKMTGQGQQADVSEVEVLANTHHAGGLISLYIYQGIAGKRKGIHGGYFNYPCSTLPCKDGYVCLIAPQIEQWTKFVKVMGEPEWSKNPRYRDRRAMAEKYPDEADDLLRPWLKEHTKKEILDICMREHIPFGPLLTIDEIVDGPHLEERKFFVKVEHPETGEMKYPGAPYELSETPVSIRRAAPRLGEHNREIICGHLGYSPEELVDLRRKGVI